MTSPLRALRCVPLKVMHETLQDMVEEPELGLQLRDTALSSRSEILPSIARRNKRELLALPPCLHGCHCGKICFQLPERDYIFPPLACLLWWKFIITDFWVALHCITMPASLSMDLFKGIQVVSCLGYDKSFTMIIHIEICGFYLWTEVLLRWYKCNRMQFLGHKEVVFIT